MRAGRRLLKAEGPDSDNCSAESLRNADSVKALRLCLSLQIVEDFRKKYDAIHVVVDIEMYKWDTDDNCCDVSIKV